MTLKTLMDSRVLEHREAISCVEAMTERLAAVAQYLWDIVASGGTIFVCGNGGSASDAQHFSAELTGRFVAERRGYPAVALTTDTSALTSIANDYSFESIFARQLEALARRGDCLIAISTSGNSRNVTAAVQQAKKMGIYTVGLLGRDGGELKELVDQEITVPVKATARVQEAHILILHLFCEVFEP